MKHTERTVEDDPLTVEYWRKRFGELLPDLLEEYADLTTLADKLGTLDAEFSGTKGYFRLQNVKAGRGSLRITAKAVRLLEKLSAPQKPASRLARQKIVSAP